MVPIMGAIGIMSERERSHIKKGSCALTDIFDAETNQIGPNEADLMLTPLQHHSNTSPPHPTRLLFSNLLYSVTDARLNLSIRYQDVCAQQKEKGEQERLTGFGGPREQMRVSDNGHSAHRVTFPTQLFVGPVCCREESGPLFGHGAEWRP